MVSSPTAEAEIRDAHREIEDLAQQAWVMSSNYQQSFVIELSEGRVAMRPEAAPTDVVRDEVDEDEPRSGLKPLESFEWPRTGEISDKYIVSVLRWGQRNFKEVRGDDVQRIYFAPGGPYEPVTIKMESLDGNVLLSRKYHPLTAVASDEELTIQDPKKQ